MVTLKTDAITEVDLVKFLDEHSDFAFEIKTLNAMIGLGFACEHGGTYDDPATEKPRQFDIRATRRFGGCFIRLAVECKNVRPYYPLLVSCLPRRPEEAFHELSYSVNPATNPIEVPDGPIIPAMLPRSKNVRLEDADSMYPVGEPVGKSCAQVGRAGSKHSIQFSDSEIYNRWAQALSSADDLTDLSCSDGEDRTGSVALSLVLPLVVVPDGQLWMTSFDADGNRVDDPKRIDRCSYFVNRSYYHRSASGGDGLVISHLEFVTSTGLVERINDLCGDSAKVDALFPSEQVVERLRDA